MGRFFESQLDWIFLIYGMGFITLGCTALFGLPKTGTRLPWRWLGLFGVVHGISEWLDMLALSLPDPPAFRAVRLAVMALSFLALVEFGRRSLRTYGRGCPGTWVHLPLLALAGMGGFAGMSGLNAASRYALAFPGALLTALALWGEGARSEERSLGSPLRHSAALMAVYAVAAGLITPKAAFFPASVLNHDTFSSSAGLPIQVVRGICALLMARAVWGFGQAAQARSLGVPVNDARRRGAALFAGILAMVLAAGWALTHWAGMRTDADMRSRTVAQAWVAAKAINLSNVRRLTGTPQDLRSLDYALLKSQLASMRTADPAYRFVYLVGMRDGRCFFFADSESPASEDYSPPGQTYEEASSTLLEVFAEGHAAAEGPVADRWGTWVSALAPIKDPDSGRVLAVLGTDIGAATWAAAAARERLEPIAITVLLVLIAVGAFAWYQRRLHHEVQISTRARELEASEARYRSIVTNMQDALYRTDAYGMVVVASPSAANLLGYDSVDELLGRRASSFWMHPEKRSALIAYLWSLLHYSDTSYNARNSSAQSVTLLQEILLHYGCHRNARESVEEHGSVSDHEVVLKRRDGSALLASLNLQGLRAENGTFLGYNGVFRDITERKRAEEALRASEAHHRTLLEALPQRIFCKDRDSVYLYCNGNYARDLGIAAHEIVGRTDYDFYPEELASKYRSDDQRIMKSGQTEELNEQYTQDGRVLTVHTAKTPLKDREGNVVGVLGIFWDITERKRAEQQVRERMKEAQAFYGLAEIAEREGITPDKLYQEFTNILPESWQYPEIACARIVIGDSEFRTENFAESPWKQSASVKVNGSVVGRIDVGSLEQKPEEDEGPFLKEERLLIDAIAERIGDITEHKQAEQTQARLVAILDATPDFVGFADAKDTHILYINPAGRKMVGVGAQEDVTRLKIADVHPEWTNRLFRDEIIPTAIRDGIWTGECAFLNRDSREIPVMMVLLAHKSPSGEVERFSTISRDITERKRAEEEILQARAELERLNAQLEQALVGANQSAMLADRARGDAEEKARVLDHASSHDLLTGLPNRQHFTARVQEHCEQAAAGKSASFTVVFLDLDQFKLVNDTLGHNAGDMLLPEVAARLRSCVRAEDMLARMGGDEFTVILRGHRSRSAVESVAARILDSISRPFEIEGHRLVIGASIGLAMCPADGTDATTLLKRADAALYKAKQAGRGTFRWYAGVTDADGLMRLDLAGDLQSALDEDQLRVYYQPIISLRDGSLRGAEALLRWEHPERGMVPPSLFIPMAEETGLIIPIGDYVLRTACAQAQAWTVEGMPLSLIGVNVSIVQMRDDGWLDGVKAALSDTGLDADRLSLELTETALAPDPRPLAPLLRKVRELGVGIAIDDFGMGHSSLGRLKDLPVSHLKIDGAFVRGIEDNGSERALLASIIEMAHDLGIKAIAEWVETQGQMEILFSSGCDLAQGYFFSPPLPADRFRSFALGRTALVSQERRAAVVKTG